MFHLVQTAKGKGRYRQAQMEEEKTKGREGQGQGVENNKADFERILGTAKSHRRRVCGRLTMYGSLWAVCPKVMNHLK